MRWLFKTGIPVLLFIALCISLNQVRLAQKEDRLLISQIATNEALMADLLKLEGHKP